MRKYELEDEPQQFTRKKLKHAKNRPGQGMRYINSNVLDDKDYYLEIDDDVDSDDDFKYNTKK